MPRLLRRGALVFSLFILTAVVAPAHAEQALVMKDGSVLKCAKYQQKGNVYVVTTAAGKLVSIRTDKVDPEATAAYAIKLEALAEAEESRAAAVSDGHGEPSVITDGAASTPAVALTNDDLTKYKGVSLGDESSVTADRPDMPDRKDYESLDGGAPPEESPSTAPSDGGATGAGGSAAESETSKESSGQP